MVQTYALSDLRCFITDLDREMIVKMMETAYKGSWMDYTVHKLRDRLEDEAGELAWELETSDQIDYDRVIAEAVDVANVAMMIHSWARVKKGLVSVELPPTDGKLKEDLDNMIAVNARLYLKNVELEKRVAVLQTLVSGGATA